MLRWEKRPYRLEAFVGKIPAGCVYASGENNWGWHLESTFYTADLRRYGKCASENEAKEALAVCVKKWLQFANLVQQEMVYAAVQAEREACAEAAEKFDRNREWVPGSLYDTLRREVAAKIRRRSEIASSAMSETNMQKMHIAIPDGYQLVPKEPTTAMLAAATPPQQEGGHIEPPYPEILPCDVLIDGVKLHKGMHISSVFTMLNRRIEDGGGDG